MTSMSSINFMHCSGVSIVDFINKCLLRSPVRNISHAELNLIFQTYFLSSKIMSIKFYFITIIFLGFL